MIRPNKTLKITDTKQLNRIFMRFIDKNGIQLECEADIPGVIDLFVDTVHKFLKTEWEEND